MKLTADQRNEIRALYALGAMRQDALATQFGISQSGVSAIVRGIETLPRDGSCVLCGAHFLITKVGEFNRQYCATCKPAHTKQVYANYRKIHAEKLQARYRTERYIQQHRIAARNYERRQAEKKRVLRMLSEERAG